MNPTYESKLYIQSAMNTEKELLRNQDRKKTDFFLADKI